MNGWYRAVAQHNPVTWMIDGMRYQIIVGFDLGQAFKAIAVSGTLAVFALVLATSQLRRRLRVA